MSDYPKPRAALNPVRNEELMSEYADKLEDETVRYAGLCDDLANADADYHYAFSMAMVNLPNDIKPAEKRKAQAHLEAEAEYRKWRLLAERQRSTQKYLASLETQVEVKRTLSVSHRNFN